MVVVVFVCGCGLVVDRHADADRKVKLFADVERLRVIIYRHGPDAN